jgi:hypothetical protein
MAEQTELTMPTHLDPDRRHGTRSACKKIGSGFQVWLHSLGKFGRCIRTIHKKIKFRVLKGRDWQGPGRRSSSLMLTRL